MRKDREVKKPPSGATKGGGNENERVSDVFYANNSINLTYCQTDFTKLAEVLELHAEVYRLRAEEARLLAVIMAGGTIYPL